MDYDLQVAGPSGGHQLYKSDIGDRPNDQGTEMGDTGSDGAESTAQETESGPESDYTPSSPGSVNPVHAIEFVVERAMDPNPECDHAWHDLNDDNIDDCTCYYRTSDDCYQCFELSQVNRRFTTELGMCL